MERIGMIEYYKTKIAELEEQLEAREQLLQTYRYGDWTEAATAHDALDSSPHSEPKGEHMTTMRLMPEELDALSTPVQTIGFMLLGAREAVEAGDKKLALSYLDIAQEQYERIVEIETRMNEPVPV